MCDIRDTIVELVEAWNSHDVERVAALYSPAYKGTDVAHALPQVGPEGIIQMVQMYLRAFPDLHFMHEETIIQGNRAALVWRARGTHRGTLMKIPATGRQIDACGTLLLTVENGKVTQGASIWDVAGLLRSIGLLPDL